MLTLRSCSVAAWRCRFCWFARNLLSNFVTPIRSKIAAAAVADPHTTYTHRHKPSGKRASTLKRASTIIIKHPVEMNTISSGAWMAQSICCRPRSLPPVPCQARASSSWLYSWVTAATRYQISVQASSLLFFFCQTVQKIKEKCLFLVSFRLAHSFAKHSRRLLEGDMGFWWVGKIFVKVTIYRTDF